MANEELVSTVSKGTRRIMVGFAAFCAVNYLVRLFSFSLPRLLEWGPNRMNSSPVDSAYFQTLSWVEFSVLAAGVLYLIGLGLIYICLREIVKLLTGGRKKMVMNVSGAWLMGGSFVLKVGLFNVALAGAGSLVGTRGSGLGLPFLMFVVALLSAAVGALVIAYLREPAKLQVAIERGRRR